MVGWDSSVVIATRYGLDGPRIESRWGRHFPRPSRPALGPIQPPVTIGTGFLSQAVKRPGRDVDHAPPSSAGVKERVDLYLYSPPDLRGLFEGEIFIFYRYKVKVCGVD